jgi:hypothetical protein
VLGNSFVHAEIFEHLFSTTKLVAGSSDNKESLRDDYFSGCLGKLGMTGGWFGQVGLFGRIRQERQYGRSRTGTDEHGHRKESFAPTGLRLFFDFGPTVETVG